jgi:hypothetical protein
MKKFAEREAIAQIFSKKITDHGRMLSILWKKTYSGAHYKIICQKNQLNSASSRVGKSNSMRLSIHKHVNKQRAQNQRENAKRNYCNASITGTLYGIIG